MRWLIIILLITPAVPRASCLDNNDAIYNLAVSQGNYTGAFRLIAEELKLTLEDQAHFKVIPGFSRQHDDRNGQADPQSLQIGLDPKLFLEGKEGACQGIAHELTHLHQFRRDWRQLHVFFSSRPVPEEGWKGCDREELEDLTPKKAENVAYECLEDNALVAHAAALDIEAILEQVPYAHQKILRDEDLNYLVENLTRWSDHSEQVTSQNNESYYRPEIKREDIRQFCRGFDAARARLANTTGSRYAWDAFCRVRR